MDKASLFTLNITWKENKINNYTEKVLPEGSKQYRINKKLFGWLSPVTPMEVPCHATPGRLGGLSGDCLEKQH
jgi:hypothetical protein